MGVHAVTLVHLDSDRTLICRSYQDLQLITPRFDLSLGNLVARILELF